jgi:hypothetical protein
MEIKDLITSKLAFTLEEFCQMFSLRAPTARNQMSAGTFAVRTVKQRDRVFVLAADALDYYNKLSETATEHTTTQTQTQTTRGRGRPRKNAGVAA